MRVERRGPAGPAGAAGPQGPQGASGVSGPTLVLRTPPANADFTQATINSASSWEDLSLAAIVPAGAGAVLMTVTGVSNSGTKMIQFRANGDATANNKPALRTQVATAYSTSHVIVRCDANRVIEYYQSAVFDGLQVTVDGWWIIVV